MWERRGRGKIVETDISGLVGRNGVRGRMGENKKGVTLMFVQRQSSAVHCVCLLQHHPEWGFGRLSRREVCCDFFFTTPETSRTASTWCKSVKIQIPRSAADVSLVCHSVQHNRAQIPAAIEDRRKSNRKSGGLKSLQTDEVASKFRKVKRRKRN